ncbi:hypothetical protein R6Q57_019674 [Mikania cordata]
MSARRISDVISHSLFFRPLSSSIARRALDPRTWDDIADVAEGDAEDIDRAVSIARKAFDEGPCPKMTAYVKTKSAFCSDF